MFHKDDLDVSKVRIVNNNSVTYNFDSIIVCRPLADIELRLHSATGSRQTYMIKNDGTHILSIYPNGNDVIDTDITFFDLFPYESILIVDSAPGNWVMIDFHILWLFRKMEL